MTDQTVKNIRRLLPRALRVDRLPARRRLERLLNGRGNKSAEAVARDLERLQQRLEKSANLKSGRYESFPANLPDARLPISEKRAEIIEAVKSNPVVIVAGATGSGKTTQIPKYCVAAGLGRDGRVGCTQPRRIAAISVASRISEEIGRPAGELVGYKIRFADQTAPGQLIKIMTDGILLAEAQQDRWLNEYDVLVIDEAHERSLNIDFILGLVQKILEKRADLKVVITSATIDTEKFSAAFNEAPVIEVSGRMYPVEVVYRPCDEKEAAAGDSDTENYVEAAVAEVDRICRENPGDILVFMPTTQDIRDACAMIKGRRYSGTVVLPLYARLSGPAQAAVFARRRERKIIVATNIAETSLTIPGIRHVVDTGLARISYYNPRTRITSLAVRKISQSSARQREGRCGRVANGTCIRLYSEKDFESRHLFTPPEILRSNLADAILRMMALGLGRIREFPFVDPPMEKSVSDGYDVLVELGAIQMAAGGKKSPGGRYRLTRQGRLMALIPVDPRLSRILIEAAARNCLAEAMVMVAALSVPDPRVEPSAHKDDAAAAQAGWTHPDSDFITLLNIWDACRDKRGGELKRFCRQQGLSFTRLREWRDVHNQIRELIQTHGIRPADGPKAAINRQAAPERFYAAFHKAVLSGYLSHIAEKKQDNTYQAAKSQEVMIFPGSALFNRGRSWIVSAEYMETTRRYARMVAAIERQWIPEIAGDLCRYVYFNPRWSKSRGEVVADRQTILFGLTVAEDSGLPYGTVNTEEAADIFIRKALIAGDVKQPLAFMQHNRQQMDEVAAIEDRLRRREFLVTADELFAFYKERLDPDVVSMDTLAALLERRGEDTFLRLRRGEVLQKTPAEEELAQFPQAVTVAGHPLDCEYRFSPGDDRDGVTVRIPAALAADVPPERLDWLVPGLLREKTLALVKGLPKEYRKKLVPLNRTVDIIEREMPRSRGPLVSELSAFIHKRFSVWVPAAAWQTEALPDHLKMRLAITGENGREIRASRDAGILRQQAEKTSATDNLAPLRRQWEQDHIDWRNFPELPEQIDAGERPVFPALSANEGAVQVRLFENRSRARAAHRQGVRRLLENRLRREIKLMQRDVKLTGTAARAAVYFGGAATLEAAMRDRVSERCLAADIRRLAEFNRLAAEVVARLYEEAGQLRERVATILTACHRLRQDLARMEEKIQAGGPVAGVLQQLRDELAGLLPEGFVALYEDQRLERIPVYLEAARLRAGRAVENFPRHRLKEEQAAWARAELERLVGALGPESTPAKRAAVEEFFWLVEEYKISVFAQEIKTAGPVSAKRLRQQIRRIDTMI